MLPLTFRQFVNQRLELSEYSQYEYTIQDCNNSATADKSKQLCNFVLYVEAMIKTKIMKDVLKNQTEVLCTGQEDTRCNNVKYMTRWKVEQQSSLYLDLLFLKTVAKMKTVTNNSTIGQFLSDVWEEAAWIPEVTSTTTSTTTTEEYDYDYGSSTWSMFGKRRKRQNNDGSLSHNLTHPPTAAELSGAVTQLFGNEKDSNNVSIEKSI